MINNNSNIYFFFYLFTHTHDTYRPEVPDLYGQYMKC